MTKASTVGEIQKLKKGDKYAVVCKECDSITVKKVADAAEVEALCHDGGCDKTKSLSPLGSKAVWRMKVP